MREIFLTFTGGAIGFLSALGMRLVMVAVEGREPRTKKETVAFNWVCPECGYRLCDYNKAKKATCRHCGSKMKFVSKEVRER